MRSSAPVPLNRSYWKLTSAPAGYPPLRDRAITDVAVVGGGITGLTTALLLKRAGRRVLVLEAARIGEGTTGYSTAKLTSLHSLTYARLLSQVGEVGMRTYAAANQWAIEQVARLVDELEIDCRFERRTALTFTTDPGHAAPIEEEVQAARRAGLAAELVRRETDLPFPIEAGIRVPDQASFHPLRYCLALAAAVEGGGSAVYEDTRVVHVEEDEEGLLRAATAGGAEVRAEGVVLACGLPFLDRGGFFARAHASRSYCLALEAEGKGELPESMSISVGGPTRSIHPVTEPGGRRLLLVAGEEHKVGQADDTRERYDRLEGFARRHFHVGEVAARWSSQDHIPVDGLPLIGRMPMSPPRLLAATGFRKWGLTGGTAAGRILADILLERSNPWAEFFDAGRTQLPEGATEVLKENADVVKRFIGDRLRQRRGPAPEELEPGTGAICRVNGEAVAAYRDESGALHLRSAVCTHLGCRVTWNQAEASWDCPCHGSRFTARGEILAGPATSPLRPPEPG